MDQELSYRIKILSFFMTCFMVFYHCGTLDNTYAIGKIDGLGNTVLSAGFDVMGVVVMSYFFAVTGFLLFYNLDKNNLLTKIKKRCMSLLVPYILWQVIFLIKEIAQYSYQFTIKDFIKRTFLLECWPIDGALWYVYAVFLLALCSPFFLVLFKNKKIGWGATLLIIVILGVTNKINNPLVIKIINHGYVPNVLHYFPAYLAGAFLGKFYKDLKENEHLVYIFSVLFVAILQDAVVPGVLTKITIEMLPLMGIFVLPTISWLKNIWIYRLSFIMYALHQPLIRDVRPLIYAVYSKTTIPVSICNVLTRVIILALDIIISLTIYLLLNKYLPKVLTLLTGGRDK